MAQVNLGHVVGPGVPTGGTANQVLVKNGSTNFDASWKDASQLPAIGDEATAREAADAALADGLAIIANGDTHAAVAAGQAVFVRSHSTLAPGLYWARSAIGTNAALSTSNLTADSQGGLNKLKGDIDSLNSKIPDILIWQNYTDLTLSSGTSHGQGCHYTKIGPLCILILDVEFTSAPTNIQIGELPAGYHPVTAASVFMQGGETYNADAVATISTNGVIRVSSVDKYVIGTGIFVCGQ